MNKNWWMLVVVGSLLTAGCTGRGGGPRAAVYPKSRVLQSSCDAAWPKLLGTVTDAGFRLVAKDDAGQIARFLYLEPRLPEVVRAGGDPDKLALARDGSGQSSSRLRIESAVLALSPSDQGCEAKISVSYQVRNGVWGGNWSSLESSGLLESRVLSEFRLDETSQAEQPQHVARRAVRRKVAAPARSVPDTNVSIIGGAEAPAAAYSPGSGDDLARQ